MHRACSWKNMEHAEICPQIRLLNSYISTCCVCMWVNQISRVSIDKFHYIYYIFHIFIIFHHEHVHLHRLSIQVIRRHSMPLLCGILSAESASIASNIFQLGSPGPTRYDFSGSLTLSDPVQATPSSCRSSVAKRSCRTRDKATCSHRAKENEDDCVNLFSRATTAWFHHQISSAFAHKISHRRFASMICND